MPRLLCTAARLSPRYFPVRTRRVQASARSDASAASSLHRSASLARAPPPSASAAARPSRSRRDTGPPFVIRASIIRQGYPNRRLAPISLTPPAVGALERWPATNRVCNHRLHILKRFAVVWL